MGIILPIYKNFMSYFLRFCLLSLVLPLSVVAHADSQVTDDSFSACPKHFADNQAPKLVGTKGKKLATKTTPLCFSGFAVLHSGVSRTPIWSAEYLTKQRIAQAKQLVREDNFHAEDNLPSGQRAELDDYRRSGFDRGHLAPNGDMSNKTQQFDSFSLANIAPQNGPHNRGPWREIESSTRYLTNKYSKAYVVTGVVFAGKNIQKIGSGVLVPSHFFKAVYLPTINEASVYYSANSENGTTEIITLNEFAERTGIDVMPSLGADIKNKRFELPLNAVDNNGDPAPAPKSEKSPTKENADNSAEASMWANLIVAILQFLVGLFK